jgi:hypothetical protein
MVVDDHDTVNTQEPIDASITDVICHHHSYSTNRILLIITSEKVYSSVIIKLAPSNLQYSTLHHFYNKNNNNNNDRLFSMYPLALSAIAVVGFLSAHKRRLD